jgi:hypothetical protein
LVKAFRDGRVLLQLAKHVTDSDLGHGTPQTYPTGAPTLGIEKPQLRQTIYHLRQMALRNVAALGNLGLGDETVAVGGTKHQDPDGNIGAFGNPHYSHSPH